MKNYIGIATALVVVLGLALLGGKFSKPFNNSATTTPLSLPSVDVNLPGLKLPNLSDLQNIGGGNLQKEAFTLLSQYREFARTHNIEGVKSLSLQISEACQDPKQFEVCFERMDNVNFILESLEQKDLTNTFSDSKQAVVYTDFKVLPQAGPDAQPVSEAFFFVRGDDKKLKLVGIKLCLKDDANPDECFQTDASKRDTNNNGWWDQVESFFK